MRFWTFTAALILTMLLLFFVVQIFDLPFLEEDTRFMLSQKKWVAALCGIGLLILDVVAPVPSSVIMFANGVLFGSVRGTVLSVVGGMAAAFVAYWIGLRSARASERWIDAASLTRAHSFFVNYGMIAVIVSRPVPILAEAVGIIAGISRMPPKKFFPAALLGILPTALIYAIAGAHTSDFQSSWYIFIAVIALAGIVWAIGRRTASPEA